MLPRGVIDDRLVHADVYSLVALRYETYGKLVRSDEEMTSGNRLPEMELPAVVTLLHYIVHYEATDNDVRPQVFAHFPEFDKQQILRRTLSVVHITTGPRSEDRRVGKEGVRSGRSRGGKIK